MTFSLLLLYASVVCGGLLSIGSLFKGSRKIADVAFSLGMAALTLDALANIGMLAGGILSYETSISVQFFTLSVSPGIWVVFSLTYASGNASAALKRWIIPIAFAFVFPVVLGTIFRTRLVHLPVHEGIALNVGYRLDWAGSALYLTMLIGSIAVLMNLERTFRASVGTIRWRIKFMLLGVGVLFVTRLYTTSQALLFDVVDPALESLNSGSLLVASCLIFRSLLRSRRFVLDVYPSQSVLKGSVTILVAGIYLLIVGLFAKVVAYFGGDSSFALKTFIVLLAVVLLAILLQSDRAQLELRRFVSRNFERPLYDYRTVWRTFTEGTASRVEQTDLCRTLARLIAEMFQALSVTIWLLDTNNQMLTIGASTSTSADRPTDAKMPNEAFASLVGLLNVDTEPIDFELINEVWAETLRRLHPSVFPNGGHRLCQPLVSRGELLGLITIGDRVAGAAFSVQDLDMLRCVGDHAAANLFNVQLSQKLLQAKELEAFQTMATFFVHDLKNAASTLKLMLQNLPVHFDDPEFRADALRGTAKTVSHIDHLIGRLGSLRHELKLQSSPSDLNQITSVVIESLGSGVRIQRSFSQLPELYIDRDQIGKVVTNLILNAIEASPQDAPIEVVTSESGGFAIVSVVDRGCGMTEEFMNKSLFKPFQTTKKGGLGIGMFQSKLIVEAHGGRLSVSSFPAKGTTFQIMLPVPKT